MRQYEIRVFIRACGKGSVDQAEVHAGKVACDSIHPLLAFASTLGDAFVTAAAVPIVPNGMTINPVIDTPALKPSLVQQIAAKMPQPEAQPE